MASAHAPPAQRQRSTDQYRDDAGKSHHRKGRHDHIDHDMTGEAQQVAEHADRRDDSSGYPVTGAVGASHQLACPSAPIVVGIADTASAEIASA